MARKQISKVMQETKKRTRTIAILIFVVIAVLLAAISIIFISINSEKNYYIHYDEKSDLDYKVYLKENDYFGRYLGKNNQYIASLIDYVEADFNYKLSIDEKIDYSYYYYVEATVQVLDTNDKPLYKKVDKVVEKQYFKDPVNHAFEIDQTVNLDYNYYNNIVNTFIKRYNLSNVKSNVTLSMYVGIEGECKEFDSSLADNAVISMNVPLTTNTVNIDMNYKLNNSTNKLLKCREESVLNNKLLILGIVLLFIDLGVLVGTIRYSKRTRSTLTIYNKKLKNIFNNYGQYISKIKTELKYEKFQIVLVEEFEDLFEVRNSSNSPILFCQDETKTRSAFVVPTNSGLVYIYYYSISNVIEQGCKHES